ncbi:MAG: hypothetical protein U1F76_11435 [Candidatus Competibacteraceae bacterium]
MQDTSVQVASPEEIRRFFAGQGKTVLTFIGYSDNGYEDPAALSERAESILREFDPAKTIVNIGATAGGIGAVYPLAKQRGFMTTGIVSTQARKQQARISPAVDRVFYVEDETWGGFLEGTEQLSPTSAAMVENSDVIVGIGGGAVGRDEMTAARRLGREVRSFPADMNHRRAIEKAKKKNLPPPTDFSGEAGKSF